MLSIPKHFVIHGRTITTMTGSLFFFGSVLNVFSIKGKTLDSPEKGVHFSGLLFITCLPISTL